jgi:hypothetical protein
MKLVEDIYSIAKHKKTKKEILYGKAGDEVKLISQHGDILIVELLRTKERFSVQKSSVDVYPREGIY